MNEQQVLRTLSSVGAVITDSHFVFTSGKHSAAYIAKDRTTRFPSVASRLCEALAEEFIDDDVDVVVSPAIGGVALSQWTAHHLSRLRPDRREILALYAEHEEEIIAQPANKEMVCSIPMKGGEKLVIVKPSFVLKRGFSEDVRGKRVLVVEDILTTGSSAARTAEAVHRSGGILVALAVLCNRGGVMPADVGNVKFFALVNIKMEQWNPADCPLCAEQVPINTEFGHGCEFLAKQKK